MSTECQCTPPIEISEEIKVDSSPVDEKEETEINLGEVPSPPADEKEESEISEEINLGEVPSPPADEIQMHLSSLSMKYYNSEQLGAWIRSVKPDHVEVSRVDKIRKRVYAFVSIKKEHETAFTEALNGKILKNKPVEVRSSKRSMSDEPCLMRPPKKPRNEQHPDYQLTILEIKTKLKNMEAAKVPLLEKTASLFKYPYEKQLKMKDTHVKSAARSFTKNMKSLCEREGWQLPQWASVCRGRFGCAFEDIIASSAADVEHGYRNKCEFSAGVDADGVPEIGFVLCAGPKGNVLGSVADLPHVPQAMKTLCERMKKVITADPDLPVYDRAAGKKCGVWRLFSVRMASHEGGQSVLILIQTANVTAEEKGRIRELIEEHVITDSNPLVKSVYLQQNSNLCDAADADAPLELLFGNAFLEMPLCGLTFDLGPMSFFQANSTTCEALYAKAIEWAQPKTLLLDICCGVGTIGIVAAKKTGCAVIGIECVEEACKMARLNAEKNNVKVEIHQGMVEALLPKILKDLPDNTEVAAIVDPPRIGLRADSIINALRNCRQIRRLIYISCNPETLASDVGKLCHPSGVPAEIFKPTRAVAVDMFPHTLHCEMILQLDRLGEADAGNVLEAAAG